MHSQQKPYLTDFLANFGEKQLLVVIASHA